MDRKLRNRILLYLALAAVLAYIGVELSGRKPVPKISAVTPIRENLVSSISSNGKVEPIAPYVMRDRKSTRLNSSHSQISYAVFCLKKKKKHHMNSSTLYLAMMMLVSESQLY